MIQELENSTQIQIESIAAALAETWNRHDMAAYAALFCEDADFVNVVGMHWRGRKEIEACHVRLHETIFRETKVRCVDWSFRMLREDVALAHVSCQMIGAKGLENWKVPEVRRTEMSLVLVPSVRSEHGWLIAALHNTEVVPVSMSQLDGK
jgi:uncharacterized protein (TIGR02246 family)